ncbi:unnamed protein product, partial [Rotaria magnacalcarata]
MGTPVRPDATHRSSPE